MVPAAILNFIISVILGCNELWVATVSLRAKFDANVFIGDRDAAKNTIQDGSHTPSLICYSPFYHP